ncbi:MAG: DUF4157 domain-containing protein [Pyrinomonadaceae bacterium]|nr:DUF4157 domain-containing protein [Pyrinomonadaceae bacterium]
MRSPISSGALTPVRGFAGNHTLVRKGRETDETQPRLQRKEKGATLQRNVMDQPLQDDRREVENRTGMPRQLKAGLETLSGRDLSGIRVHRNSSKPDQLNAWAYTEGQEIHLAPGQERHLPHEGWHAVQQMQGRVTPTIQAKGKSINDDRSLEREADLMGAKAVGRSFNQNAVNHEGPSTFPAAPPTSHSRPATIQREMKFEIQTFNKIWRNDGVNPPTLLDRKYGPSDFLVKGATGVRLESETNGVLEFETDWFRKWSALEKQLKEAREMTTKMNGAPAAEGGRKAFPFPVDDLRKGSPQELKKGFWDKKPGMEGGKEKILGKEEKLEVEIVDDKWNAGIQSSEGILLEQYESLLKQHEFPAYREPVIASAQTILDAANSGGIPATELVNLRSFLQIIVNYIMRGQGATASASTGAFADVKGKAAKQAFILMNRTDFSSIYQTLLMTEKQQSLFKKIVQKDLILKQLGLDRKTPFFIKGYGMKQHHAGPTVYKWLAGIHSGKDLLSVQSGSGVSAAMGKYDVEAKKGEKDTGLVKFETRNTVMGAFSDADGWVDYARKLFQYAAENRKRPETKDDPDTPLDETEKTTLIYDPKVIPTHDAPKESQAPSPRFELLPKLTLELGDEKKPGLELEFRKLLPTLLDGKLQPFVYTGIGTGAISAGVGASFDPFKEMSLFLTGKGGIRSEWFTSIEVGGGLEAGWAFGKNRSLRLGIGWEEWKRLDGDKQRTHLVDVFFSKRF